VQVAHPTLEEVEEGAVPAAAELRVNDVSKAFGPTQALRDVTVAFAAGRVHGLLGENGSGKSTLVKIIAGVHTADEGEIAFGDRGILPPGGEPVRVSCVYQDGTLIAEMTVAQNLELIVPSAARGRFGTDWVAGVLAEYGVADVDPSRLAGDIAPNRARLVEVAAVLATDPEVVMFDESTSTLDADGVQHLLGLMRRTAERGACVLFVTHRLSEVLAVADDLRVLRDGRLVAEFDSVDVTEDRLIEAMAGREVAHFERLQREVATADPVLVVEGLVTGRGGPVSFSVRPGEILGIGGAAANGQAELVRALAGEGVEAGTVRVGGVRIRNARTAVRAGVQLVTSDRRAESLSSELSIRENFTLSLLTDAPWYRAIRRGPEVIRSRDLAERFGLVASSVEQPANSMSGGNQQKLAVGRVIAAVPKVLVVEEPTEGVDARSRFEIYRALTAFAAAGAAVVVASSDASELQTLTDRVIVLARARTVVELAGEDATETRIVQAFTTATHSVIPAAGSATSGRRPRRARGAARPWDPITLGLLLAFMLGLGLVASLVDARFAAFPNLVAISMFAIPIILVAMAELPVIVSGQIDASLGSVMALTVVIVSFLPTAPPWLLLVVVIIGGAVMGGINALLVVALRINSVIATIATLGIFLGIATVLRPTPGGFISPDLGFALGTGILGIPVVFLLVVVLAIGMDVFVYRSRFGLRTRATGYSAQRAVNLNVPTGRLQAIAFVWAGALAGVAGLVLATRVGVGDPSVGSTYTLLAIAVPVLGGAILTGGHGSALGCLIAGLFVAEVQILVPFLNFPSGGYLISVGALTIIALLVANRALLRRG
jgi:ABC-type sugar transport system ATPase subunit/ribose/xylose/arabinose/galactoside ABC-type transport system permease subunit